VYGNKTAPAAGSTSQADGRKPYPLRPLQHELAVAHRTAHGWGGPVASVGGAGVLLPLASCARFGRINKQVKFKPPGKCGLIFSDVRLLGATAGPERLRTSSGSKSSAGCTKIQPWRPIIRPVREPCVLFIGPTSNKEIDKRPI
jgi:hypothetical protein